MCISQKSISISRNSQRSLKNGNQNVSIDVTHRNEQNRDFQNKQIQTLDDRAQAIRSNKSIIRRHLRNSLQIPKSVKCFNLKQENLTAASLKDLDFGADAVLKTQSLKKEQSQSTLDSQKTFQCESQKLLAQMFQDKYSILKKIGQGAHSTVYKCMCKNDNKNYALKKLKNVSFQNLQKLKNFFRMMKNLHHQNIINYEDFFFDQDKRTAFVVMELCEYNDLRYEISKRSLSGKIFSSQEIQSITKQIASVLKYLHSEGICHRDLKPENILYSNQSGQIKVIDLDVCGVKKFKNQSFELWTNTGTLFYRAPQSFEIGYSEKVDIWSLGVIVYELITGQVPFETQYEKDFLNKIKNTSINFERVQASKKLLKILEKTLEKDSKKRGSAIEVENILDQISMDDCSIVKSKVISTDARKYFDDSFTSSICIGNLLKFSYY